MGSQLKKQPLRFFQLTLHLICARNDSSNDGLGEPALKISEGWKHICVTAQS